MRTARTLAAAALIAASTSGCTTLVKRAEDAKTLIQRSLDAVLPASFEGDTYFSTRVTYGAFPVAVTIRSSGLKRGPNGWEWRWLSYSGDSPISHTSLVFGPAPATLLP